MSKLVLIATCVFMLGGCSTSQPIKAWQQQLTDYTMKEGDGNLNVLRESAELRSTNSPRPAQIRFDHDNIASSGLPPFVDMRDAHGVMVGQYSEGGTPVFFFLVGVVERPYSGRGAKVEDVRLVSCTVHNGNHYWKISEPSPDALSKYLALTWAGPPRTDSHPSHRTFPLVDDDFRFEVRGGYARAADSRSGAEWRISLN